MDDVCILHLSDIHAGKGELVDEDQKIKIPGAERAKQLDRLSGYVSALPKKPDLVVVSGDITNQGDRGGMETFRKWLFKHIEDGELPKPERIILVPGNHDVAQMTRYEEFEERDIRFDNFWQVFGTAFPHAHIPRHDPKLDVRKIDTGWTADALIGGIKTSMVHGEVKLDSSLPFLLDLENDVLIFAFNSAHGCALPREPDPAIYEPLEVLLKMSDDKAQTSKLRQAMDAYLKSLVIDVGLIKDDQLTYFSQVMSKLRGKSHARYDRLTKIAVLHHHVSSLWKQQLELKNLEATLDASQLKQVLVENSFDIVLHGHKHTNHVGIDGALIPVSDKSKFNPLCIVSGGTVGGYPRLNDVQSFKLLYLEGTQGPRSKAIIKEIPIRVAGNYADALANSAKTYHAPTTRKLPLLHDIDHLKVAVDNFVIEKCAPELVSAAGTRSENTSLAPYNKKLFASSLRYRCPYYLDDGKTKVFYEIMLATERLDFRASARVHWLATDALGDPGAESTPAKVIVIVANLEETHFSQVEKKNEVKKSLEKMRADLAPAIKAGTFEIRDYLLSQDEIIELTRIAEAAKESAE